MRKNYSITLLSFLVILMLGCDNTNIIITEKLQKNTNEGFYYLDKPGTVQQPDSSKVCWAVCLANIHNAFFPTRNLTFCEILGARSKVCTKMVNGVEKMICSYDFAKESVEIKQIAADYDLELIDFNVNRFKDFNNIKSFLNTSKVPIIIQKRVSPTTTHLIYVYGYGTENNCNYYLVFDPEIGNESYTLIDNFIKIIDSKDILNTWCPKVINPNSAKLSFKKFSYEKYINDIEVQIENTYKANKIFADKRDSIFDKPKLYIKKKYISLKTLQQDHFLKINKTKFVNSSESCDDDIEFIAAYPSSIKFSEIIEDRMLAFYFDLNLESLLPRYSIFNTNKGQLELKFELNPFDKKTYYTLVLNQEDTLQNKIKFDEKRITTALKEFEQINKLD